MKWLKYGAIFLLCLFLVACASNERKTHKIKEEFITKIDQNNLKLFTYTATMTIPEVEHGVRRGDMRSGNMGMGGGKGSGMRGSNQQGNMQNTMKRNREKMVDRMKEKFYEKLDVRLTETGYCREGYIVLDNYFIKGRAQIRGECKDNATEEDRLKFSG